MAFEVYIAIRNCKWLAIQADTIEGNKMAGGRLTRDDWIGLARKTLVASGVDDVKVDLLARRMKVTRGSFYHHFGSRKELLDAILKDWADSNRSYIETLRERNLQIVDVFRYWLRTDAAFPAFDIAVRVWARKAKSVAKTVQEIDLAWIEILQSMLISEDVDEIEASVRARVMYFHQVGYYALAIKEKVSDRIRHAAPYYKVLTGKNPPADIEALLEPEKKGKPSGNTH